MKKKIICLCLAAGLFFSTVLPARAENYEGGSGWQVSYSGGSKLNTNFKTSSFSDTIRQIQPGDTVKFSILLKNEDSAVTDWYMTNRITRSLEEHSVANGGAYTYVLTYTPSNGSTVEFFNSDRVGGELAAMGGAENGGAEGGTENGGTENGAESSGTESGGTEGGAGDQEPDPGMDALADEPQQGENVSGNDTQVSVTDNDIGLHEATKELERSFFLVDTLSQGQTGRVELTVTLEGETQGNDYQDTLADLTMEFAVERRPDPVYDRRSPKHRTVVRDGEIIYDDDVPLANLIQTDTVRTSDDNRLLFFTALTLVSGLALLLMALYCRRAKRKEEE